MGRFIRPGIKRLAHEEVLRGYLSDLGIDLQPLVNSVRFKGLDRIERLDSLAEFAVHNLANQPEGHLLAPKIGQLGRINRFGVFGHAVLNCGSIAEAMRVILKHMWIVQEQGRRGVHLREGLNELELVYANPPMTPRTPHFRTELFFSAVIAFISELSGRRLKGVKLELVHDPGCRVSDYAALLGVAVSFCTEEYRLCVPRPMALDPLPASYITHSEAYLTQCEALLSQMKTRSGVTAQLRRVLLREKPEHRNVDTACSALTMSERTLRRRLNDEGTNFQEVLDEVRNHLALDYLRETELSVSDIATLLGYSDASTFRKAFKKWNGGLNPHDARLEVRVRSTQSQ